MKKVIASRSNLESPQRGSGQKKAAGSRPKYRGHFCDRPSSANVTRFNERRFAGGHICDVVEVLCYRRQAAFDPCTGQTETRAGSICFLALRACTGAAIAADFSAKKARRLTQTSLGRSRGIKWPASSVTMVEFLTSDAARSGNVAGKTSRLP
jgi:hypothetical protein